MVYTYGCIDLIVKSSVLRNPREVVRSEGIQPGYYDSELICFPLGMSPWDAEDEAKCLSRKYHFSLPEDTSPNSADSVVIEAPFGPTTECDWIEDVGNGCFQLMNSEKEWDAERWKNEFNEAITQRNTRPVRAKVFKSTQAISEKGEYEINGKTIQLERPGKSTVYSEEIVLPEIQCDFTTQIEVIHEDCLAVARTYSGKNPLVLNMASRQTPGGGVIGGAGAQEECLFRSSNYYQTLYEVSEGYPMDRNFGGNYSPDVTVFRDLEENGYALLEEPFKVSFVGVSAINNPALTSDGHLTREMENGTINKIKTILNIAILNNHKFLILSAFGCGAFHNPPDDIANLFKKILSEKPYNGYFEKVIFAIKPDHNDPTDRNYSAFEKCFK